MGAETGGAGSMVQFGGHELVVFVGYANDASVLATAVCDLERELQAELRLRTQLHPHALTAVKVFAWELDAPRVAGGQDATIRPALQRADIGIFVFHGRVGAVTWMELEGLRGVRDPPKPILAIFPKKPPADLDFGLEAVSEAWTDLLRKKRSLTAGWTDASSAALAPHELDGEEDLRAVVTDGFRKALNLILASRATSEATPVAGDAGATDTAGDNATELAKYRDAAEARHATIEPAGFKTKLRVPIDLEELYVPLRAVVDLRAVDDGEEAAGGKLWHSKDDGELYETERVREIALTDAFGEAHARKRRGLVILGDPGSGKTTHLKRLLLWCLRRGPAGLKLLPDALPVFLPLRELRDLTKGLDAFIEQQLDSPHLAMEPGFGKRLLDRGKLLLLLDGLDEVADEQHRAKVADWIEDAARSRPDCTLVVTSRFAGYTGDAKLSERFLELHVRPLTAEQSAEFVRNWYRLVETNLAVDPAQGEAIGKTRSDELLARLGEPGFRMARMVEMTRNPLLLANLCLVHRDRGALPRGRAKLYDECVEVLLERWREAKGLSVQVRAEDGRKVLQPAALWMHGEENRTRATAAELEPVLESALQAVQWMGGNARTFLRTVRDESGLLVGWGQDQYGFMHLGFQEYLAAREIRRRSFKEPEVLRELAQHHGESWWQEVALLLVALTEEPSVVEPYLAEVLKQPALAERPELLDALLEDAAETPDAPFVALVTHAAGKDRALWVRQLAALRVLERLKSPALDGLTKTLRTHPSPEIQRWLRDRGKAEQFETLVTDAGAVELLRVPGGTFMMGSPASEEGRYDDEGPQHEVTVPPFLIGKYPVTNEEYGRFLAANPGATEPSEWGNRQLNQARQPVVGVSWDEAVRFAEWAGCRLPTEAEWECSARAGTTAPYLAGPSEKDLDRFAWYGANAGGQTHPVGEKAANAWGLHDVLGNAWEWVEDDWHGNYEGAPRDGSAWVGKKRAADRVGRGGSWAYSARDCRVAYRAYWLPAYRYAALGFRVARSLPSTI